MNKKSFVNRLILTLLFFSVFTSTVFAENKEKAEIKFEETVFDFGNIKEDGGPVSHEFKFVNKGGVPLVINSARAECGCTRPEYPENAVGPGKNGVIKVTYNPMGRPGGFTKTVTVRSNGDPAKVILKIRGTVLPKK